jgi:hypothetical protein
MKLTDLQYDHDHDREVHLLPKAFGVYRRTYSPEIQSAWKVTEALLAELKREADTVGSKTMVFYVPHRAVVYPDQWERVKRYYAMEGDQWKAERVAQELGSILERLQIEYINPLERMRQHKNDPARRADHLFFLIDGHWNREGNRLAGEILADHIVSDRDLTTKDMPERLNHAYRTACL